MGIMESLRSKLLLHKEEGWKTTTSSGLPTNQQMDYEKLQRFTINSPGY